MTTIIKAPKYGSSLHPSLVGRVTVERDKDAERDWSPSHKVYNVHIDGEYIGYVSGDKELSHTTYKGTRIRRDLGYPMQWRGYFKGSGYGSSAYGKDSRAQAAIDVAKDWLDEQPERLFLP